MARNHKRKPQRPGVCRAAVYCRVSTGMQAANGASIDAQKAAGLAEVQRRGWQFAGYVIDAGESGTVRPDDREHLGPALAQLDAGEIDAIVATRVDRVSRSVMDFGELVQRADRHGWTLVTLDLPEIDPSTPMGKALRTLLSLFGELERDLIAARTAEGMAVRKAQGWPNGKPGHDRAVPAELVSRIRAERDAGASWRKIADGLNSDGIAGSQGGKWWPMTCRNIAADPAY